MIKGLNIQISTGYITDCDNVSIYIFIFFFFVLFLNLHVVVKHLKETATAKTTTEEFEFKIQNFRKVIKCSHLFSSNRYRRVTDNLDVLKLD